MQIKSSAAATATTAAAASAAGTLLKNHTHKLGYSIKIKRK